MRGLVMGFFEVPIKPMASGARALTISFHNKSSKAKQISKWPDRLSANNVTARLLARTSSSPLVPNYLEEWSYAADEN
jgi:hypothetical protein